MCSVYGALGYPDQAILDRIAQRAQDRGRDGGRREGYALSGGRTAYLGNWRAAPTPEKQHGPLQPYDRLVHNGTIANDQELGARPGEIDSQVLARVLDRTSLDGFVTSLSRVVGSYALAVATPETVFLAANYKPLYLWSPDGVTTYWSSLARHFDDVLPFGQAPLALRPYSALDLTTRQQRDLPRDTGRDAVVICSAGLDSTTVAAALVAEGVTVRLLHFRYGCRAEAHEVARIPRIAERLGCTYEVLDLDYRRLAGHSPLLTEGAISDGVSGSELAHEWVPARNLVMLATATAYAEANGFHVVALGNNLEEAGAYPDNEEEFTLRFAALTDFAVHAGYRVEVRCPVAHLMKPEIVALGARVGAPFDLTWSCYRNDPVHCGACGPCFMRRVAFERAGVPDPTRYAA